MAQAALAAAAASDSEWLDDMVTKLKDTLQAQIERVNQAAQQPGEDEAKMRASDARTLATLERTLERLAKLECERAAVRETKVAKHEQGAREALERRLDKLAATGPAPKRSRKPQ